MAEVYEFPCPSCGATITERTLQPGQLKRCRCCGEEVVVPVPPAPPLGDQPYGLPLAERVADFLQTGGEIPPRHPYFNGVCLAQVNGAFLYGYANEGGAPAFFDSSTPVIRRFADRAAFVSWLAAQSDITLNRGPGSGLRSPGEVGITRQVLESAVGPDPAAPAPRGT